MSWTKRQFIEQAFEEIGLAAYVFDLSADQLQSAMRRLDAMMAYWNSRGIRLGYPIPGSPQDGDIDADTGVPDAANLAIYANLAIQLAPSFGKAIPIEEKVIAKMAYDSLLARAAMPMEMQLPGTMPLGAGHKSLDQPFVTPPIDPLLAGPDGELSFT